MADPIVKCPTCGTTVAWIPKSVYRPFCSERCRLIDLGEWASGNRSIPGTDTDDRPGTRDSEDDT